MFFGEGNSFTGVTRPWKEKKSYYGLKNVGDKVHFFEREIAQTIS